MNDFELHITQILRGIIMLQGLTLTCSLVQQTVRLSKMPHAMRCYLEIMYCMAKVDQVQLNLNLVPSIEKRIGHYRKAYVRYKIVDQLLT